MKIIKDELGGFQLVKCLWCRSKKAFTFGGHVHSETNFKRTATAGWCKDRCDLKAESGKCAMFNGGCFGVVRLRGFKKKEPKS